LLDVEDVVSSRYHLEISSTGMERPLVKEEDFTTYQGVRIKVQMAVPFDGKRKFIGILNDYVDEKLELTLDEDALKVQLPYEQIKYAHLFFTDEDMRKMMNGIED
jgi:ribosome maturation factor RimP